MKITIGDIYKETGGEFEGNSSFEISAPASIDNYSADSAVYVSDGKMLDKLKEKKAGCVILAQTLKEKDTSFVENKIFHPNPRWAFTLVLRLFIKSREKMKLGTVNERALVSPLAKLGRNVSIAPNCIVGDNAKIGDNTVLEANVFVGENSVIGDHCKICCNAVIRENCALGNNIIIHSGAVIGADGYGFVQVNGVHEKIPHIGGVIVGNDVEIGANTTIDRGMVDNTIIGEGTKIDNLVQIGHNVRIGKNCLIIAQAGIAGSCNIGNYVTMAGQVGIADHINIGDGAVLIAKTGVMSDVEPKSVLLGAPARPVKEAFKIQAIISKLPEIYEVFKKLKKKND